MTLTSRSTPPRRPTLGSCRSLRATCEGRYGRNNESRRLTSPAASATRAISSLLAPSQPARRGRDPPPRDDLPRRRPRRSRTRASDRSGPPSLRDTGRRTPPERAAPAVLGPRPERDRQERDEHQHVPRPPAELPVAADRDREHCLAQQDHRHGDSQDEDPATLEVEAERTEGGERVEPTAGDREERQRTGGFGRGKRAVERWQRRERDERPRRQNQTMNPSRTGRRPPGRSPRAVHRAWSPTRPQRTMR